MTKINDYGEGQILTERVKGEWVGDKRDDVQFHTFVSDPYESKVFIGLYGVVIDTAGDAARIVISVDDAVTLASQIMSTVSHTKGYNDGDN